MYDYSGSREEFSKDDHLSDEQILEIVDAIHRMVKSNDLDEQREAVFLCGKMWVTGHSIRNMDDEKKSYNNENTKKLLGEIAGGKFENFTIKNIQYAKHVLFDCLQSYILKLISETASSYVKSVDSEERRRNTETMMNDCYMQFDKDAPKYDPEKSAPLTYFSRSFSHAISEFKNNNRLRNLKPSVSNDVRRVANAAAIVRDRGGDEEDVVQLSSVLTGMSYERIFTTLGIKKALEQSQNLDDTDEISSSRREWIPEEAAVAHETQSKIYSIIHDLKDPEREIFCMIIGVDLNCDDLCLSPMSVMDVAKKTGMKKNQIEAIYHRAITYIKEHLTPYLTGTRYKKENDLKYKQKQEIAGPRINFIGSEDDETDEAIREIVEINVTLHISPDDVPEPPVD